MNHTACAAMAASLAVLAAGLAGPAVAQAPREVPARSVPVPDTVSPQLQKIIGAPINPNWNATAKTRQNGRRKPMPRRRPRSRVSRRCANSFTSRSSR